MDEGARFPRVAGKAGHYESFYVKACQPGGGRGIWIRHTVHKRPRRRAQRLDLVRPLRPRGGGAAGDQGDRARQPSSRRRRAPGSGSAGRRSGPGRAEGSVATDALSASWGLSLRRRGRALQVPAGRLALRGAAAADQVRRARSRWPTSTAASRSTASEIDVSGWPGMIGHNWGSEHAERWVWLEGTGFADAPGTYFDAGAARIELGRRDQPLDPLGDADARRRGAPPRRPRRDPLGHDRGGADRLRVRPARQGHRRPRPGLGSREGLRRLGLRRPEGAASTTPSTAPSPTSS